MMAKSVDRKQILTLLEEMRAKFPHLQMDLVDLSMDIFRQHGLPFDVRLNLQGDELHLNAGSFWLEWFPCTDPEIVGLYRDAVIGLLSGKYRILQHYIGSLAVKAELQRPQDDDWQTVGIWSNLSNLIPWRRTTRVLQAQSS